MSNTPNDGGPAFPRPGFTAEQTESQEGMSLRDWFAGQALNALIANPEVADRGLSLSGVRVTEIDKAAYTIADAMLRTREQ